MAELSRKTVREVKNNEGANLHAPRQREIPYPASPLRALRYDSAR